ncbi:MAG: hypothetical protein KA099_03045 [Alphaproteobacteria bacterium]|nr:hypothetical protein [Alphaproteobacteria bacterium]MBP7759319.1 hypothetical protein [Alphaproteobacteria bacterium]MBP7762532.1 hypothetical protein [Alphaproteobacteria bacterium]MBP7904279.1 hypothetical protein [Alphaproteobacteria bacterium]
MTRITEMKTTFTAGEVSRELLGRGDLRAYDNGALTLRNVFINPTGGVRRRFGLGYIDTAPGNGKLIAFEFNTEQTALLLLTHEQIDVYTGGLNVATIAAPWEEGQIAQIAWTQSADTLLLVHPDVPPKKLTRGTGGTWTLSDWNFFTENNVVQQPYYKFADSEVTLTPSATTGSITLTASVPVFSSGHENTRLRVGGKEVLITDFDSPTVVSADVIQTLTGTSATIDWAEQAFSPVRGYPVTVAFHQDRLVIGGSRDLPNRLWFSKSGDLFNFDLGTGLEDEAIEFAILSDQVNAIRGVFSSRHLQVFTSGAEWMVTGDPLTPSAVQIRRQTRTGSVIDRYIPPLNVDGATLYAARNKKEIHEFLYTDLEQAYTSTDLALLSRHIIDNPVEQDYDQRNRLLFVIRADGKFATLTVFRAESVSAWTLHETNGNVKSVSVVGDEVYMLIERAGEFFIELFDSNLHLDSALLGEVGSPTSVWSGLDHLEGRSVSVVADGAVLPAHIVTGGAVALAEPASTIEIGLPFTHIVEPLPPNEIGAVGAGRKVRLVRGIFRVKDTSALRLDTGQGLKDISLRQFGEEEILDEPTPLVSGDIKIRALGWQKDGTKPLWRIEQSAPLPFELLSVITELKVNE